MKWKEWSLNVASCRNSQVFLFTRQCFTSSLTFPLLPCIPHYLYSNLSNSFLASFWNASGLRPDHSQNMLCSWRMNIGYLHASETKKKIFTWEESHWQAGEFWWKSLSSWRAAHWICQNVPAITSYYRADRASVNSFQLEMATVEKP